MRMEKLITGSSLLTLVMVLAGVILYGWHLAIHPEPQLTDPGEPASRRTEGVAALVAVANRHEDDAALRFTVRAMVATSAISAFTCAGLPPSGAGAPTTVGAASAWWCRKLISSGCGQWRSTPSTGCEATAVGAYRQGHSGKRTWSTSLSAPGWTCFPAPCVAWQSRCGRWPRYRPWSSWAIGSSNLR